MSIQRHYAQRNTNVTQLVPERYSESLSFFNISNAAIYTINITKAQLVGGIYYIDLSQPDTSGNALDFSGTFASLSDASGTIFTVIFAVNIDTTPSAYPGLEFTLSFKNVPFESLPGIPFLTIGIISASSLAEDTIPLPYIVSPPFPPIAGQDISPNITFKSDGDNFDVVASGPAGWFGVPALAAILNAYNSLPPP
jgi:hypothetical protein